jgi:hypothetical protein
VLVKRPVIAAALALAAVPALAQTSVSVAVGQPGFYGRIDIGGYPPPPLVYPQPVIVHPGMGHGPPVYLHVPPGHAKHWSKHCAKYGACAQPVYFVQDGWYDNVYVPGYQAHAKGRGKGPKFKHDD